MEVCVGERAEDESSNARFVPGLDSHMQFSSAHELTGKGHLHVTFNARLTFICTQFQASSGPAGWRSSETEP